MPVPQGSHGGRERGLNTTPSSSTRDGRFGRMFRTLPALQVEPVGDDKEGTRQLQMLADAMVSKEDTVPRERELEIIGATSKEPGDEDENAAIPAGYTYLGQFIDHDITFDPISSLRRQNDPDALHDFRTPALDLDSLYGRGPADEPFRYDRDPSNPDNFRFVLGGALSGSPDRDARDLPRMRHSPATPDDATKARAIIGDPRNDENVIITQLQSVFMRFHNAVSDDCASFDEAQQRVRWHYQWLVIWDFLKRICGEAVIKDILQTETYVAGVSGQPPTEVKGKRPSLRLKFYRPEERAFMPVEFSVAAYRFGHSMVRPFYRLNAAAGPFPTFSDDSLTSLNGFQPLAGHGVRERWAIDWRLFFDFGSGFKPTRSNPSRVQPSYKIDTSLVDPLANLPIAQFGNTFPSLAHRNLLRGWRMGLPSGESVALDMGLAPLDPALIKLGPDETPIASVAGGQFEGNTPLWLYVLAEAQQNMDTAPTGVVRKNLGSSTLGPVGARIVAETIIGLIAEDRLSFLRLRPFWRPIYGRDVAGERVFEMRDLIQKAGAAGGPA